MSESEHRLANGDIEALSIGGKAESGSCTIESSVFDTGRGKWAAITIYDENMNPVGICDFQYFPDTQIAKLESPIIRKRPDLPVPAFNLRMEAEVDGIYMAEGSRGSGKGTMLLTTAMALAKQFGARSFVVKQGEKQAKWYKKLGGKKILGGVSFDLNK